jgi:hypothetical protein
MHKNSQKKKASPAKRTGNHQLNPKLRGKISRNKSKNPECPLEYTEVKNPHKKIPRFVR